MEEKQFCGLIGSTGKGEAQIALRGVAARIKVVNNACQTTIEQHYVNTESIPIEAVYSFPLPMDATVCGFKITDAERELVARVMERDTAFDAYDQALANNHSAYLLDQDTPNHFTCSVGNLAPGQDVVVSITYVQLLRSRDGSYRVSLPSVIAEVYTPLDVARKMDPADLDRLYPPRALNKLPYGLSLKAEISMQGGVKSVDSPSHPIRVEMGEDIVRISFSSGEVQMDRDLVLNIEPVQVSGKLAYFCPDPFQEGWIGYAEFMPKLPEKARQPKNIIFIIDCSGSMRGDSIESAKSALLLLLASLREGDRFNIIAFGSDFHSLFTSLNSYDDSSLDKARAWVQALDADLGGTEILSPLKHALETDPEDTKNIILLTDGEVGNNSQIQDYVRKAPNRPRIFTIGLGRNADEELIKSLPRLTGGESEFAYPGERLEPVIGRHLARMDNPVVTSLSLNWGGQSRQLDSQCICLIPNEPLYFMEHLDRQPEGKVSLVASLADGTTLSLESGELQPCPQSHGGLPQLYAKHRLQNPGRTPSGSRQRMRSSRDIATEIAVKYQILSEFTSFVVSDPRRNESLKGGIELRRVPVVATLAYHAERICACAYPPTESVMFYNTLLDNQNSLSSKEDDPILSRLVLTQTANGYWDKSQLLHLVLGNNKIKSKDVADRLALTGKFKPAVAKRIGITLVVVYYLEYFAMISSEEYQTMLDKAKEWLAKNKIQPEQYLEKICRLFID